MAGLQFSLQLVGGGLFIATSNLLITKTLLYSQTNPILSNSHKRTSRRLKTNSTTSTSASTRSSASRTTTTACRSMRSPETATRPVWALRIVQTTLSQKTSINLSKLPRRLVTSHRPLGTPLAVIDREFGNHHPTNRSPSSTVKNRTHWVRRLHRATTARWTRPARRPRWTDRQRRWTGHRTTATSRPSRRTTPLTSSAKTTRCIESRARTTSTAWRWTIRSSTSTEPQKTRWASSCIWSSGRASTAPSWWTERSWKRSSHKSFWTSSDRTSNLNRQSVSRSHV